MTTLATIQAEQLLADQRTSHTELTISFSYGKPVGTLTLDPRMVAEVIGKGGTNIAVLSKAAGISWKPFYDKNREAFVLNNLPTPKMEALQKEVQQFLRVRLGERTPTPTKTTHRVKQTSKSNMFEHLDEPTPEPTPEPTSVSDSTDVCRFRVRGNIASRQWWKEHWQEKRRASLSPADDEPVADEDNAAAVDELVTVTLAEFDAQHPPKMLAAKKSPRQIHGDFFAGCTRLTKKKLPDDSYTF